jgi:hypothetical protein
VIEASSVVGSYDSEKKRNAQASDGRAYGWITMGDSVCRAACPYRANVLELGVFFSDVM